MLTTSKLSLLFGACLMALTMPVYSGNIVSNSSVLTEDEKADLLFMREEEKLARDTYLTLYDKWAMTVFSNIASSEQSHMDALLKLLKKYRLPDPAASTAIGEFTNPDLQALYNTLITQGLATDLDAVLVGGLIEETDMRDIQAAMDGTQQADIDAVYESLMCGSRNHLRAFAANYEGMTALLYRAQVLDQQEVDEILTSPDEQCGE
jgi:hypothetical protein